MAANHVRVVPRWSGELPTATYDALCESDFSINPDDLARAIREDVDARLRALAAVAERKSLDNTGGNGPIAMTYARAWASLAQAINEMFAPAPREPAQERQDKPEPPQHAEAMADMLRELEGWKDGPTSSDDTIRKHWLMRRAAATIRDLMARQDDEPTPAVHAAAAMLAAMPTPTPAGGADPLLPGLRYVREHYHASPGIMAWLDAEIARREGGWQPWQPTHRHYKGGLYRVLMEGTYEASGGRCVIYQGQDGRVWVRMRSAFVENVVHEGVTQPRFAEIAWREGA